MTSKPLNDTLLKKLKITQGMMLKMACIECKNILDCGTIKRQIRDFSVTGLIREINSNKDECSDFEFEASDSAVLRLKISELNKLSKEHKLRLKQAKNKAGKTK